MIVITLRRGNEPGFLPGTKPSKRGYVAPNPHSNENPPPLRAGRRSVVGSRVFLVS